MLYRLLPLALFILLISCTRRPQEYVYFEAINNSGVRIEIFDKSSAFISYYAPEQGVRRTLATPAYGVTKINEANFGSVFNVPSTPLKVVYNNADTVYHYNDSLSHSGVYLNLLSVRCLFNIKSYDIATYRNGDVGVYTFTPSDYEFAKE